LGGYVEEVRQYATDLMIEHSDELTPSRDLNSDKLFDGKAERMFLGQRSDIIEAVEIRYGLEVSLCVNQLLRTSMKQADMGVDPLDNFAVSMSSLPPLN
jgi:hypothetical protein